MDYTEMLKQEFLDRKARRPSYSERAFARDLRVSPGYISLLFRGHRALRPSKGLEIAQRLGWSEEKIETFVALIQKQALRAVSNTKPQASSASATKFAALDADRFRFIADLNHVAALTLIQSRHALKANQIPEILSISILEAEMVVGRLIRMGLVRTENGKLKTTRASLEIKEVPSSAIRTFHRQVILKAETSIEEQTIETRNLAALTVSFDPAKMDEAKAYITRFLKTFEKKFGNARDGEIYQMNTQFFRLSLGGK